MNAITYNLMISTLLLFCILNTKAQSLTNAHKVVVKDVKHVSAYTYLLVDENNIDKWVAVKKIDANVGETYYYVGAMEMNNFTSKELNKTFDKILFLESISKNPTGKDVSNENSNPHSEMKNNPHGKEIGNRNNSQYKGNPNSTKKINSIKSKPVQGGITISQLLSNPKNYDGKVVIISAQVTKYSATIMSKNWIHLQDGTEFNGKFDLTATTDKEFKTGDDVIIEGKVSLNKDFGYGYFYEVILEDAKLKQ